MQRVNLFAINSRKWSVQHTIPDATEVCRATSGQEIVNSNVSVRANLSVSFFQ